MYGLIPLVNGKSYEWADITINILGLPSTTATKISYKEVQNMANVMGPGNKVTGRVYKDFEPTASVTILMQEIENFQSIAPGGKIQAIPEFDITVSYLDSSLKTVTHILKNCRFTTNSRESERGGGEIEVELELIIADIQWAA